MGGWEQIKFKVKIDVGWNISLSSHLILTCQSSVKSTQIRLIIIKVCPMESVNFSQFSFIKWHTVLYLLNMNHFNQSSWLQKLHHEMLSDKPRTTAYQTAIKSNAEYLKDKVKLIFLDILVIVYC